MATGTHWTGLESPSTRSTRTREKNGARRQPLRLSEINEGLTFGTVQSRLFAAISGIQVSEDTGQIIFCAASLSSSPSPSPRRELSTSRVCSPSSGGGTAYSTGVSENRMGLATVGQ